MRLTKSTRPLPVLLLVAAMSIGGASMAVADDHGHDDEENGDYDENDHSPDDENGEIADGEETSSFDVVLDWRNEVDTPAGEEPDDPEFGQGQEGATGIANLRLDSDAGVICADIQVDGLDADDSFADGPGAHVHQGAIDANGPIAVFFETPDEETGMSSGCFSDFEDDFDAQETLQAIEENPENWYVNVHSGEFPSGVVRGQLPDGGQDQLDAMMEIPEDGVETGAGGTADTNSGLLAYALFGGAALAVAGLYARRRASSDTA